MSCKGAGCRVLSWAQLQLLDISGVTAQGLQGHGAKVLAWSKGTLQLLHNQGPGWRVLCGFCPSIRFFADAAVFAGYAVADVDYGGSTGYGREYRNRLRGAWGEVAGLVTQHSSRARMRQAAMHPAPQMLLSD